MSDDRPRAWNSTLRAREHPMKRAPFQSRPREGQVIPLRRAPLKPRSARTAREYVTRRAIVAELLAEPSVCEVPWCAQRATDPHEPLTRARGGNILDRDNIRLICGGHHREIHDTEPGWAYDLGFLVHSWDAPGGAA